MTLLPYTSPLCQTVPVIIEGTVCGSGDTGEGFEGQSRFDGLEDWQ